jgi:hypothetical protein
VRGRAVKRGCLGKLPADGRIKKGHENQCKPMLRQIRGKGSRAYRPAPAGAA